MKNPNSNRINAALYFFGPGGGSAPQRSPGQEAPVIKDFTKQQQGLLNQFIQNQPLLAAAQTLGLDVGGAISQFVIPVLQSGGALTPQQKRTTDQTTEGLLGSSGSLHTNAAIGTELMNRQSAQDARFNTALGQAGTGLSQMEGVETTAVQSYAAIEDPILSYLGNLFGENLQAQTATQTANTNKTAGVESGALSAIGSIAKGAIASDKRLKEKIKSIGEKTPEGIPIKTFQYKGDPVGQRFVGVLAQDVEKKIPEAVLKTRSGLKMVDFSKIDFDMIPLPLGAAA